MKPSERVEQCAKSCAERAWRLAFRLVWNRDDAADVVQEALLVVARRHDRIPHDDPWPWFAAVIVNVARDLRKKRARRDSMGLDMHMPDPKEQDPSQALVSDEERRVLMSALEALSEDEREAITLVVMSGLTHQQAATALGIPRQTLSSRVQVAMERLRRRLGKDEAKVSAALLALPVTMPKGGLEAAFADWTSQAMSQAGIGGTSVVTGKGLLAAVGGIAVAKYIVILTVGMAIGFFIWMSNGEDEIASNPALENRKTIVARNSVTNSVKPESVRRDAQPPAHHSTEERPATTAPTVAPSGTKPPQADEVQTPAQKPVVLVGMVVEGAPLTKHKKNKWRNEEDVRDEDRSGSNPISTGVAGARVVVRASQAEGGALLGSMTTDAEGTFSIDLGKVAAPSAVVITANAEGYCESRTKELATTTFMGTGTSVPLYRGSTLGGKVVDAGDATAPKAGALVFLKYLGQTDPESPGVGVTVMKKELSKSDITGALSGLDLLDYPLAPQAQTTAHDGGFRFDNLLPGHYAVQAVDPADQSVYLATAFDRRTNMSFDMSNAGEMSEANAESRITKQVFSGTIDESLVLAIGRIAWLRFTLNPLVEQAVDVTLFQPGMQAMMVSMATEESASISPDAEGVFSVAGLCSRHVELRIRVAGYAEYTRKITPRPGEDLDLGRIELEPARILRGRVEGASGQPVAGASITLGKPVQTDGINAMFTMFMEAASPIATATSAADGSFEILSLPTLRVGVSVTHADHAPASLNVSHEPSQREAFVVVKMPAGCELSGRIIDLSPPRAEDTTKAPPIRVGLMKAEGMMKFAIKQMPRESLPALVASGKLPTVDADEHGKYHFRHVLAGDYLIIATRGELGAMPEVATREVTLSERRPSVVDLTLGEVGSLSGYVNSRSGAALIDKKILLTTNIFAESMGGASELHTQTDAKGFYRFEKVPVGTYYIMIEGEKPGVDMQFMSERSVVITAETPATKDIRLDRTMVGTTIRGRVLVDGNAVFAHCSVMGAGNNFSMRQVMLEADGNFEVEGLLPGGYVLVFSDAKASLSVKEAVTIAADVPELRMDIDRHTVTVSGVVSIIGTTNTGSLEGITVSAAQEVETPQELRRLDAFMTKAAAVSRDGSFVFEKLIEGRYSITAMGGGFAPTSVSVEVHPGVAPIQVLLSQRAGRLEASIGEIQGNAEVMASIAMPMGMLSFTNDKGEPVSHIDQMGAMALGGFKAGASFTVGNLAPGKYSVEFVSLGLEPYQSDFEIRADETTRISVTLHYGSMLKLRISNPDFTPSMFKLAKVTATRDGAPLSSSMNEMLQGAIMMDGGMGGVFKLPSLAAGRYTINIALAGYAPLTIHADVPRNTVVEQDVTLVAAPDGGN